MADNETIADIIAEMRALSNPISDGIIAINGRQIADRLDAAHRREADYACEAYESALKAKREALREQYEAGALVDGTRGDSAKLREALEHMVRAETYGSMERDDLCGRCLEKMFARCKHDGTCWVDKAITALAAPPRNCDRYATVDEAMDDFADEALIEQWNALKAGKDRDMLAEELFVFTKWLFVPATEKEGGTDGNE